MTSLSHANDNMNYQAKIKPTIFEKSPSNHLSTATTEHEYPEMIDFETDNVSNLYNNPALFSNRTPGPYHVPKPESQTPWGMPRLCLFLCPAFCVEFCRVFAAMFMLVQVAMHFTVSGLPLLFGGLLGLAFTVYTSSLYRNHGNLTRKRALAYFLLYHLMLFFGTALIVGASWSSLSFEDDISLVNISNSGYVMANGSSSSVEIIVQTPKPPILNRLFTAMGYIVLSSTTGSGQYLILCVAASVTQVKAHKSHATVVVVLTAFGACAAGIVDVVVTFSNWCPARLCPSHVTAMAAVISSGILCLLGIGLACSVVAYHGDVIHGAWRRLRAQPRYRRQEPPPSWDAGRRSTRTAQEIYDECAPLLRDHETSFSGTCNSNATDDNDPTRPFCDAGVVASTKRYPHQITPGFQEPNLKKMLKTKRYIGVLIGTFLLLTSQITFQFYSSLYLSQVTSVVTNRTDTIVVQNATGIIDWTQLEEPALDWSHVVGLKINGFAVLLSNGIFVALYLKRKAILDYVKPAWHKGVTPCGFLVLALLACVTGITSKTVPFLLTACVISWVKVIETIVLHSLLARLVRTWPPIACSPTDGPSTVLWCLIPLSMVIASSAIMFIHDFTRLPALAMYFTAVLSLAAGFSFWFFGIKVESA